MTQSITYDIRINVYYIATLVQATFHQLTQYSYAHYTIIQYINENVHLPFQALLPQIWPSSPSLLQSIFLKITTLIYHFCNKLECFYLEGLSSLV
jgi:hypothetical protein